MKSKPTPARLSVLSLACLAAVPAWAQTQAAAATLAETVVTASRIAQPLTDVLADVSILEREQLEQAGLYSLGEVLAQLPGVQLSTNGSYRSSTGLFLRGASTAQTILLVNGVRVGSATSGQFSLENLPLERIERVEVLRGAAAALYGADAVGGVIQVFTREPSQSLQRSARVGLGSDGQRQAGASIQGRSGELGYALGVSQEKADGINVKTPGAFGFNADADGYRYTSADVQLRWTPNAQHTLGLTLLDSEGEYDFDGAPFPAPLGTTAANTRAVSEPALRQLAWTWEARWTPAWQSTVRLGHTQDRSPSRYWSELTGKLLSESRFDTTRDQLTWQNDIRWGQDVLTLAVDARRDRVDSTVAYRELERTQTGWLASYAKRAQTWDALLSLRHDHDSQFGSFDTWSLSAGYRLDASWRLVASTGTTFQAPTFNQLYYPGYGNPTLQPQRGRSHEVGLRYAQGGTRASLVVYRNEVEGFITPATNVQSARALLRGATLSWEQAWGDTAWSTSYDYADPRLKPSDTRVSRVAQHVLQTQVTHRIGAWQPFAQLRLSGDRFDAAGNATLAGYGLLNVGTSYQIDRHWKLAARINNLTDRTYSLASGYTTPGRNLFVSLQWSD